MVAEHIRTRYIKLPAEVARRERHARRQALYQDGGLKYIHRLIEQTFTGEGNQQRRKQWAEYAGHNNVLKRLVNELSTSYQEAPERSIDGDQTKFDEVQTLCEREQADRWFCRALNLHRALLRGFRVRNVGGEAEADRKMEVVSEYVTPDQCFLVTSPRDHMRIIAVGIKIDVNYARPQEGGKPEWVVWSARERFYLTDQGGLVRPMLPADSELKLVDGVALEHGIGRIPYTFARLDEPAGNPWPGCSGEDMVAAHMSIWFAMACMLKETKSATKAALLSGDVDAAEREQDLDTDNVGVLPEGVALNVTDLSMDLEMFAGAANHVLEVVANNYGMSAALLKHQGVQSAEARDLMRVPLRELRLEQRAPLRAAERDYAQLQAAVLVEDWPAMAFNAEGFAVLFADPQTPRSTREQLTEFEHARRLSVDSTIEFLARANPDLDEEQVRDILLKLIGDEVWRNMAMRPLTDISGSTGAELEPGPGAPQQPPNEGRAAEADDADDGEEAEAA